MSFHSSLQIFILKLVSLCFIIVVILTSWCWMTWVAQVAAYIHPATWISHTNVCSWLTYCIICFHPSNTAPWQQASSTSIFRKWLGRQIFIPFKKFNMFSWGLITEYFNAYKFLQWHRTSLFPRKQMPFYCAAHILNHQSL